VSAAVAAVTAAGAASSAAPGSTLGYGASILLGLVQGLTEFLPISSSGHLVLAEELLHVDTPGILVEVALHVGTLGAVFIYFRREIAALIAALPRTLSSLARGRLPAGDTHARLILALVIGTLPAALVAVVAKDAIEASFQSVRDTLIQLAITGVILQFSRINVARRRATGLREGFIIGCAQAVAILPGISRSATTISAGVFSGVDREEAARFSMLLLIPAVLGAMVLSIPDLAEPVAGSAAAAAAAGAAGAPIEGAPSMASAIGLPLLAGVIVSFLSGLFALRLLIAVARRNRFDLFSWYLWAVAAAGFVLMR
jgi:undecaprenyl-diphosphatase